VVASDAELIDHFRQTWYQRLGGSVSASRPVGTDGMGTALSQPRPVFGAEAGWTDLLCAAPPARGPLSEAGQEATSHT
jgi:hypothetical protein